MEKEMIDKILTYIEGNLNQKLTLEKISSELNYSKFYVARVFADKTGCTIYQYIRGRRLTEAARKLALTEEPIVEIAYEAQYNSQQAFTLAFRRYYLCTPSIYRENGEFYPGQVRPELRTAVKEVLYSRENSGGSSVTGGEKALLSAGGGYKAFWAGGFLKGGAAA